MKLVLALLAAFVLTAPLPHVAHAAPVYDAGPSLDADNGLGSSPSDQLAELGTCDAGQLDDEFGVDAGQVAGVPLESPDDPAALAGALLGAAKTAQWGLLLALIVNALVWVGRHGFIARWVPWFTTRFGGYFLAGALSLMTVGVVQLVAWDFDLVALIFGALTQTAAAVGLYQGKRDVRGQSS